MPTTISTRSRSSASCSIISRGIATTELTCSTRTTIRFATKYGRCTSARRGGLATSRRLSSGTTTSRRSRSWPKRRRGLATSSAARQSSLMSVPLKQLQSILYRLITAASGVAEGLAAERNMPAGGLDALVLGDDRLTAEARVDIYANMYFYRLL